MRPLSRSHGVATIYALVIMIVLLGLVSLAVDFGHVQLAKAELQRAADAAARYGVAALGDSRFTNNTTLAKQWAVAAAAENRVDGKPLTLDPSTDIKFIACDPDTQAYQVLSNWNLSQANGLQITPKLTPARQNAIPLMFGWIAGLNSMSITSVKSTIYVVPQVNWSQSISAKSNPWLAGMPDGSIANPVNPHDNPDYAGMHSYYDSHGRFLYRLNASPQQVNNLPIVPGQPLTFSQIGGGGNNDTSDTNFSPDGNLNSIAENIAGAENGMSNLRSPINALVGVFLTDSRPDRQGAAPSTLDFSTPQSRNFQSLSPQLRQVFFIGDGKDDNGNSQHFVVPPGATRLFIGTMDAYEWNNNQGTLNPTATRPKTIIVIK